MSADSLDILDHSMISGQSYYEYEGGEIKDSDEVNLWKDDKENLCKAFALLDVNGDGVLEMEEMRQLFLKLGRLDFDDAVRFMEADAMGAEGAVGMNFFLFHKFMQRELVYLTEKELRTAFEVFDSEPLTGKLNLVELRESLKSKELKLTDDEIDFLFREEDYWMVDDKTAYPYDDLINKILGKPYTDRFLYNS